MDHDLRNIAFKNFSEVKEKPDLQKCVQENFKDFKDAYVFVSSESMSHGGIDLQTMTWFVNEYCKFEMVTSQ